MQHDQIALQLWTVRHEAARDLEHTLREVAAAGYGAVELAGLHAVDAGRLATLLRDNGLRAIASHEGIERLREDLVGVVDRLGTIGCDRIIVPWLPDEDRGTIDDVRAVAVELGSFADRLAPHGMRLGFHNHDVEFTALDGSTVWDTLLDALPSTVEIELDVYWASVGGRDPVTEIVRLGDRVRLLHMKDRAATAEGEPPRDAPPGEGTLPFDRIVAAARAAGVEWYVIEQDEPGDPLRDIAIGYRNLISLTRS